MSSFLVLSEGDTRNRWRDGQVCPDVGQGTMAPWARWLGCVLACYAQIGRGRSRETFEREGEIGQRRGKDGRERRKKTGEKRKKTGENGGKENREEMAREEKKRVGEGERGARLVWRKGLSPEIGGGKNDERRWR
ncbi:hypothetical protein TNCV_2186581 [Trichonephila clavipes]|nr:hypothetical protein TNCV_2186581 [Trichonephila clavipes]